MLSRAAELLIPLLLQDSLVVDFKALGDTKLPEGLPDREKVSRCILVAT